MGSWLRQPPHPRRADVALALQFAQKPALFEVAERSVPSRIAEALAHVGRAGLAWPSSISQTIGGEYEIWNDRRRRCRARIRARGAGQGPSSGLEQPAWSRCPRRQSRRAWSWCVRGLGRGSREPRLRVARRALAKRRVSVEEPTRLERPGAHRCDESLRRDESETRPRRSRRQVRERGLSS